MNIQQRIFKYATPFLLIAYTCFGMATIMIIQGNVGFGLPFIGFLFTFGVLFIFFDFFLKKMFLRNGRKMIIIESVIALFLLIASLYLEARKSTSQPSEFIVEPVEVIQ